MSNMVYVEETDDGKFVLKAPCHPYHWEFKDFIYDTKVEADNYARWFNSMYQAGYQNGEKNLQSSLRDLLGI